MKLEQRLSELYIDLPEQLFQVPAAVSPCVQVDKVLRVLGCLPFAEAKLSARGHIPSEVSVEAAKKAAKQCFVQALAQIRHELGSLESIKRVTSYELFLQTESGFADHAKVADPLSDLIKELFGKTGKHGRSLVGVASLPQNASVVLNVVFEIK